MAVRGNIVIRFEQREYDCECPESTVKEIMREAKLSLPAAYLLCRRGTGAALEAKRFLHPGPEQLLDPFLLPDMRESAVRIKAALVRDEKMTVFCDYDADGTCGGCALYLYLKEQGADVSIMTPNRHREGYGLSPDAVKAIAAGGAKLIITVDCGITNVAETAIARSLGLDVIITDHHECGELPDTPYIINPKRADSAYPFPHLAGCGIAFKLIHALSSLAEAVRYIDLIAVGTITDIVPLLGENRAIAHMGLKKLRTNPSEGLKSLVKAAGIDLSKITSYGVSFGLGPRINAAGRMDTAELAISILSALTPSPELRESAEKLCELNDRRRQEVDGIQRSAEEMILKGAYMSDSVIMLADEAWNAGVIGIAAAKIAEKYTRPCVLFGGNEGKLVGSARSIEGINIFEALSKFAARYEKFGGHAQAAGLTIDPGMLDKLRSGVCRYIDEHYGESVFQPKKIYDIKMDIKDITADFVRDLGRLEPFGQCNEKPVIAVFGADIRDAKFVGNGGKPHLKFSMRQGGDSIEAVSFYFKDSHSFASETCDCLCEAGINDFNGLPQLIVREFAMRYDETLIEGFLNANSEGMIRNFINEVVDIAENGLPETISEQAFISALKEEIEKSRFGLCVEAPTAPAFRRLTRIKAMDDALRSGELSLFDDKAYSADNCVACSAPAGHGRALRAGAGKGSFFDAAMLDGYIKHAKLYFAGREEMLLTYRSIPQSGSGSAGAGALTAAGAEKRAFMLRVFEELELIEICGSGRIHAIKAPKKQLRQSVTYRSFEDFISRPQSS